MSAIDTLLEAYLVRTRAPYVGNTTACNRNCQLFKLADAVILESVGEVTWARCYYLLDPLRNMIGTDNLRRKLTTTFASANVNVDNIIVGDLSGLTDNQKRALARLVIGLLTVAFVAAAYHEETGKEWPGN